MDSLKDTLDNSQRIIHKERSKENLNAKGHMALGRRLEAKELKEDTVSKTQMQMSNEQQAKDISKHRLAKMRINAEIDEFLTALLLEGMINESYWNYHAKACHTLGISLCNRLAINARNGINSQRLYAVKVTGAMQLHFKREYEQQG